MLESMYVKTCHETCELEKEKEKERKKEAVSAAAADVHIFQEEIDPKDYPTLLAKNIVLTSDKDIMPILREIVKLAKEVKSTDLLKVLNANGRTTSLVVVPCGNHQARCTRCTR
jgi:hypothetical protein